MIANTIKLLKERRKRIKPIAHYKVSKRGHLVLDVVNPRRIAVLFLLVTSCILWGVSDLIQFPQAEATQEATKANIVVETITQYIKNVSGSNTTANKYAPLIYKYAKEQGIDPYVLTGLVKVESTFDRYAISKAGALGLTQVMPVWHKEKIQKCINRFGACDLLSPEHNLYLGSLVLKEYKEKHRGNINKALLSYNGSLYMKDADYDKLVLAATEQVKRTKWKQKFYVASL